MNTGFDNSVAEMQERMNALPVEADALTVQNQEAFEVGGVLLVGLLERRKAVTDFFEPMRKASHAAYQRVLEQRDAVLAPIQKAEALIRNRMAAYVDNQNRLRLKAESDAREAARKVAEAEREVEVAAAVAEGASDAEVVAVASKELVVIPEPVAVQKPAAEGISARKIYRAQVVSLVALIGHVAKHPDLVHLLEPNQSALNGMARSLGDAFKLPGCILETETGIAARSNRRQK